VSADIIPNNASAGTADSLIKFNVEVSLPKGTVLQVLYPAPITLAGNDGDAFKDLCWSNIKYTRCESAGGNSIELELAED